jgi:hypothetical protein
METSIFRLCFFLALSTLACSILNTDETVKNKSVFNVREIVLNEDTFIQYGRSKLITFDIPSGVTILRDCPNARLIATVHNSPNNIKIPSNEAELSFKPERIDCQNYRQKIIRSRKVVGRLNGEGLRGVHTHIYGPKGVGDAGRFGFSLNAGSKGFLELESVGDPYSHEDGMM